MAVLWGIPTCALGYVEECAGAERQCIRVDLDSCAFPFVLPRAARLLVHRDNLGRVHLPHILPEHSKESVHQNSRDDSHPLLPRHAELPQHEDHDDTQEEPEAQPAHEISVCPLRPQPL